MNGTLTCYYNLTCEDITFDQSNESWYLFLLNIEVQAADLNLQHELYEASV